MRTIRSTGFSARAAGECSAPRTCSRGTKRHATERTSGFANLRPAIPNFLCGVAVLKGLPRESRQGAGKEEESRLTVLWSAGRMAETWKLSHVCTLT